MALVPLVLADYSPAHASMSSISDLRYSTSDDYTRVVLELSGKSEFDVNRLRNPDRIYIDINRSRLDVAQKRAFRVNDGVLGDIRYAQYDKDTVRVVMEMSPNTAYKVFRLDGPPRVVIDFYKTAPAKGIRPSGSETMASARKKLEEVERKKALLKARVDKERRELERAELARIEKEKAQRLREDKLRQEKARSVAVVKKPVPAKTVTKWAPVKKPVKKPVASIPVATVSRPEPKPEPESEPKVDIRAEQKRAAEIMARKDEARKLAEARSRVLAESQARKSEALKKSSARLEIDRSSKARPKKRKSSRFKRHRIVVDAGHGGKDPGAIGPGRLMEKSVVLDIAKRLKRKLEAMGGYEVILTRSTDKFIELENRAKKANDRDADLFVSIHANASRNKRTRGLETYYLNRHGDEDTIKVAARENNIPIEKMKSAADDVQSYILTSLAVQNKQYESARLAGEVREGMFGAVSRRYHGVTSRKSKMGPFYVLYGARMPAVLVEVSYITNKTEAARLKTSTYRDYLAGGIAEGISSYLKDSSNGSGIARR